MAERLVVFQTSGQRVLQTMGDFADYLQFLTKKLYSMNLLPPPVQFNEELEQFIEGKGQVGGNIQVIYSNITGEENENL